MNPIELVKQDLTTEQLENSLLERGVVELPDQCPFVNNRIFAFYGATREFDFPTLPHGSFCLYAANGTRAIRLSRAQKEICQVLAQEWQHLSNADPIVLASLILKFYDGGIKSSHRVLKDEHDLIEVGPNYTINVKELDKCRDAIGETSLTIVDQELHIRAVTLMGWMHNKSNLGVERLTVDSSGSVMLDGREQLSKRIFKSTPQIRY